MVPHGILIEISILCVGSTVGEHLRELQHVVRVARLRTIELVYVAIRVGYREKMLVDRVSAYADSTVLSHILPEVLRSAAIARGCGIFLEHTLHTNIFWYLGVGMLSVKERGVQRLHTVEHLLVGKALGSCEILSLLGQRIGIK